MTATTTSQAIDDFRAFAASNGFDLPTDIQDDGEIHRFKNRDEKAEDSWYKFHSDHPANGVVATWGGGGKSYKWNSSRHVEITAEERAVQQESNRLRAAEREARRHAEADAARVKAEGIWNASAPADANHTYLARKGIAPHGIRAKDGSLVIPMRDTAGTLHSLQFIAPDGTKRFFTGGVKAGNFHMMDGPPQTGRIFIAEGYATAASVRSLVGSHPVVVAFDCGNLLSVAAAIREAYPTEEIVIAGDDDRANPDNPGRTKAAAAASFVGGIAVFPVFPDGTAGTDWNDLSAAIGFEKTREIFNLELQGNFAMKDTEADIETKTDGATGTGSDAKTAQTTADGTKEKTAPPPPRRTPPPPKVNTTPRRSISEIEVENALAGTMVGTLTNIFRAVAHPQLEIGFGLSKALTVAAMATSKEDVTIPADKPVYGAARAKLAIQTSSGNIPNLYSLMVAPASMGKDMGGLLRHVANHAGGILANSGSSSGLKDALIERPNGLFLCSEFAPYINDKSQGYHKEAANFLTEIYDQYQFDESLSKRTAAHKENGARKAAYCAPNLYASIQPERFRELISSSSLTSGFLSRFAVFSAKGNMLTRPNEIEDFDKVQDYVNHVYDVFAEMKGRIKIPANYPDELLALGEAGIENPLLISCYRRLVNQVYPRFALFLSIKDTTDQWETREKAPEITAEGWAKAKVVVLWCFANAERLVKGMVDSRDVINAARVKLLKRVYEVCRDWRPNKPKLNQKYISLQTGSRLGDATARIKATAELISLGVIADNTDGGFVFVQKCDDLED